MPSQPQEPTLLRPSPTRRRLPDTRNSLVHEFKVGDVKGFLNIGLYEDGTPGEVFINVSREGSTIGGLLDSFAAMTSLALQHGVTLEELVHKFAFQKFEPNGHVRNRKIAYAHSIIDYIFRWMGHQFIPDFTRSEERKHQPLVGND